MYCCWTPYAKKKFSILLSSNEDEGCSSYLIHCRQGGTGWREGVFYKKEERFFRFHTHPLSDQEAELTDWTTKEGGCGEKLSQIKT